MGQGSVKKEFLDFMTSCGVLLFGDFLLKSGRRSPYFINTGEYGDGKKLMKLGEFYADMILDSGVNFDVLYGPAYKGIPLAAAASVELARQGKDRGYSFNRKEDKEHGDGSSIMGRVPKNGEKIAIIEDVTTAGTSVRETIELFKAAKIDVKIVALFISVDRAEKGTAGIGATKQIEKDYGIEVHSIVTTPDIIDYLTEKGETEHAEKMREHLAKYGV